ncbi:hypothetical protein HELRODRAFT_63220, partial [Helobdella robusta]|uniref:Golgi SNAP receptor complex member 1 n=1 Tax=Helobdella robusta TaxID=6412 RepID=T1FXC6_HELRO
FQELRKQARQLENEIDLKLVSFSKLGTNYRSVHDYGGLSNSVAHRLPYNNADSSKSNLSSMSEAMSIEIEHLLANLTKVNDKMSEYTQSLSMTSQNATLLHMLQRHRDILQDYSHEFHKTKSNIMAVKEREELLGSLYRDNSYKPSSQTDMYLKEHQHLINAERLVDEQINIAVNTKENLQSQRGALHSISNKVNSLTNRFPVLNNLIVKINLRKKRDSIILACVIGFCIIFIIWFLLR